MKYRLRDLREDRDLNQQDIANLLNMTRTNYSRIENENVSLSFDDAVTLANFYNISIEELLTKRNNKHLITSEEILILKESAKIIFDIEKRFNDNKKN